MAITPQEDVDNSYNGPHGLDLGRDHDQDRTRQSRPAPRPPSRPKTSFQGDAGPHFSDGSDFDILPNVSALVASPPTLRAHREDDEVQTTVDLQQSLREPASKEIRPRQAITDCIRDAIDTQLGYEDLEDHRTDGDDTGSNDPNDDLDLDLASDDGGVDDDDENDVAVAVDTLCNLLYRRNIGCGTAKHERDHTIHMAQLVDNHHDLSRTYESPGQPPTQQSNVGLYSERFPTNQEYPRHPYPDHTTMKGLFEGVTDAEQTVPHICLHAESEPQTRSTITFDVDGFIGFPRTLGALRRGFRWCPAQHMSFLIRDNLEVRRRVQIPGPDGESIRRLAHLRDIPHLYLGMVDGLFQCALYIFFPRLTSTTQRFRYLDGDTVRKFVNRAMLPSCQRSLEQDRLQHIPPSQEVAELKARAKGVEQQQARGERGLKNYTMHNLQPEGLSEAWDDMESLFDDPSSGLEEFRGAFLVVNAKNLKMDFKSELLSQATTRYEENLRRIFDFDLMIDMIHDVAFECCPMNPTLEPAHPDETDEPTVYLWKTCCLKSEHEKLRRDRFGGRPGEMSLYHLGFLQDASAMTLVPPRRSQVYRGGWIKAQWYASVKEIGDANATYPFSNKDLTQLAVDPRVWKAHVKREKLGSFDRLEFLQKGFVGNKERVRESYRQSEHMSFSVRFEGRTRHKVFKGIQRQAIREDAATQGAEMLTEVPPYVWGVSTPSWCRFTLGNYDKFITALEVATITSPRTGIPLERSKLIATLIKCVQRFSNCDPARDAILWYASRTIPRGRLRGLGFEETMSRHGYGWLNPVIDWQALTFHSTMSSEMVRADRSLSRWYAGSGRLLQDTNAVIEVCFSHLGNPHTTSTVRDAVVLLSVHICLREYRRDVMTALKKEVVRSSEPDFDMDTIRFCYADLVQVLFDAPHLVSGNKSKTPHPDDLFEWIWGDSDAYSRRSFCQKPYRIMQQRVRDSLRKVRWEETQRWQTTLKSEFFRYHWLIPYPDPNGTLISTAKKTDRNRRAHNGSIRQWWSAIRCNDGPGWVWGRTKFVPGYPNAYPQTLNMEVEELKLYLHALN